MCGWCRQSIFAAVDCWSALACHRIGEWQLSRSLSIEVALMICNSFSLMAAEAVVQALQSPEAEGKAFALTSTEGEGPGSDAAKWAELFRTASP
jgi:hypothetical protein